MKTESQLHLYTTVRLFSPIEPQRKTNSPLPFYVYIHTVYIHPYLFISLFGVSIRVRKSSTLACFFYF